MNPIYAVAIVLAFIALGELASIWSRARVPSLLVAMLMHASLSASTLILQPPLTGAPFLTWNLALTAILWVVVAAVALGNYEQVSRQPLRRRAA